MQAWFPSGVMLLHFCDEQEVEYNIAGAQLHSGHLLLWWRVLGPRLRMSENPNRHLASPIRSLYPWKFAHTCHAFFSLHTRLAADDLHDLGFPKRSTTVFLKGDGSIFKHFVSLFRGCKATHQSVAGYPVSRVRDMESFGEYPVSLCSFGWSPRDQVWAPASLLFCPFAIARL